VYKNKQGKRIMRNSLAPNPNLVVIPDNKKHIDRLLTQMVLQPRVVALRWAEITKQTANIKIGYPGQHLASLITGMQGEKTGARGNDLKDGTEVKSCSRIDQLDKCGEKDCGQPVARYETACSACESKNIQRKNDSKWLFTIRSEGDLKTLLGVPRVLLVLGDYPHFEDNNFNILRFQSFEIWPAYPKFRNFSALMTNYYYNIYKAHKDKNPAKTPAPKNFWPYSYQFYMCNPIKTFECRIDLNELKPDRAISIGTYVEPGQDRSGLPSEPMPIALVKKAELAMLAKKVPAEALTQATRTKLLSGALIEHLILRGDRTAEARTEYVRRTY
jgi:hypothetical protein